MNRLTTVGQCQLISPVDVCLHVAHSTFSVETLNLAWDESRIQYQHFKVFTNTSNFGNSNNGIRTAPRPIERIYVGYVLALVLDELL